MLEARDISFGYSAKAGGTRILDDVSLTVLPEERVAISAPSGRGKTTLCRILAGYLSPEGGEVLLDGSPLPPTGVCPVQLVGQHPELTLDPRMRMGRSLEEASLDVESAEGAALLESLGIRRAWLSRFPHELSGGELQRFCIARAIATHPKYLICDEISTMLDALTQAQIWQFLLDYTEENNIGLAFVSHSPALTERIATRVFSL